MLTRSNQANSKRGDTLIEVLFAVTVFSLVAVGGLSIMNQGLTTAQRALEITLVRQQIDAQAETLRFMHSSYVAAYQSSGTYAAGTPARQWSTMLASITATDSLQASAFGAGSDCPTIPDGSFLLNSQDATFVVPGTANVGPAQVYSRVNYTSSVEARGEGIWIEAVRSRPNVDPTQANVGFIDFHIRACWDSPGQSIPVTLGTIVRLYEPRG